jgi:branched-chain amino acid transport system substrate-binding protein
VYRPLILFIAVLLGTAGSACAPAPPRPVAPPTRSPIAVSPIVIGALLDIGNDAGPDSRQHYDAATLAVEIVNRRGGVALPSGERRPLQLVVYDGAGQASRVEPAMRRIDADGVLAVLGPSDPDSTAVARPVAEAAGVPLIALGESEASTSTSWRWTFTLMLPPEEALAATIDFFAASGVDRFAWLSSRTLEAPRLRGELGRLANAANVQIAAEDLYPPGEESFSPRLSRLHAAEPRVIFAWPRDAFEAASIVRESARVRNLAPLFVGPAAASPTTLSLAGDLPFAFRTVTPRLLVSDDLWDHDPLTPVIRDFRRELQARTGRPPTAVSAGAWDAVNLIVTTLEKPMSRPAAPTRASLRDGLEATTDYLGASGPITFEPRRHDGLDRRALVVARSEGRRWRLPP